MNTDIGTWERVEISDVLSAKTQYIADSKTAYALIAKDGEVLYAGSAGFFTECIKHLSRNLNRRDLWVQVHEIAVTLDESRLLQDELIKKYNPPFNLPRMRRPKITLPILNDGMYLYRYHDRDKCVYIGITKNLRHRSIAHKSSSPWYNDDLKLRLKLFTREENARAEEIRLIEKYRPSGNKIHNPDWKAA